MEFLYAENPYSGQSLIGFFLLLARRAWSFAAGNLSLSDLASDELQVLVLMGIAVSGALVGTFLILRKMTMLANSLSHTILLGIIAAFLLTDHTVLSKLGGPAPPLSMGAMLCAAAAVGLLTTFLTEFLSKTVNLQEDASNGLVFTSLFALGIIAATLASRNSHIGTEAVMGDIDILHLDDFLYIWTILGINILLFSIFYKEFQITTFDPTLAKALGISPMFFNYLLMVQTAGTAIGGFKAVGVLMVLSFMTTPPLIAKLWSCNLKTTLLLSAAIGCIASILGVGLARHVLTYYETALSTGGVVVCVMVALYLISISWKYSTFMYNGAAKA